MPRSGGRLQPVGAVIGLWVVLCLTGGCCSTPKPPLDTDALISPERLDRGYTLLLPGIFGNTANDHELLVGLGGANLPSAIEMYDWTEGPWLMVYNLRGLNRNRREARKIAEKIVAYQDRYPGRPVHLVGYSGGGGVAVLALEALPPGRRVTSAILLGATLAPDYDLRLAMSHTEQGIRNFYSPADAPVLVALMTVVGTTEGRHTGAAGARGFTVPKGLEGDEREAYERGLIQQKHNREMFALGNEGGHFGWLQPAFVQQWLAPLVTPPLTASTQPVSYDQSGADRGRRAEVFP